MMDEMTKCKTKLGIFLCMDSIKNALHLWRWFFSSFLSFSRFISFFTLPLSVDCCECRQYIEFASYESCQFYRVLQDATHTVLLWLQNKSHPPKDVEWNGTKRVELCGSIIKRHPSNMLTLPSKMDVIYCSTFLVMIRRTIQAGQAFLSLVVTYSVNDGHKPLVKWTKMDTYFTVSRATCSRFTNVVGSASWEHMIKVSRLQVILQSLATHSLHEVRFALCTALSWV